MRSVLSRFRLRSQASTTPLREALYGSTLLTMNSLSRRPCDGLGDDLLGAAVAVHLGGVDQSHAELDAEPHRGCLLGGAAAVLAHVPGARGRRPARVSPPGNVTVGRVSVIAGLLDCRAHNAERRAGPHRRPARRAARTRKAAPIPPRRQLDHGQRLGREPAGRRQRRQRRRREPAAIGRVEKRHRAGERGARRPGRIAGDDLCPVLFAERRDIAAQRGQRLAAVLDKGGGAGAARQRFEAEGAGAGKGVEHRAIGEGQAGSRETAMRQDVEQRLAGAVAGRPHRLAGRHDKPAPAMHAADDAQRADARPALSRIRRTHISARTAARARSSPARPRRSARTAA